MKKSFSGSKMVRASLYRWATNMALAGVPQTYEEAIDREKLKDKELEEMELKHPRIKSKIGTLIVKKVISLYRAKVRGSDLQTRTLLQVTALLFDELFREL